MQLARLLLIISFCLVLSLAGGVGGRQPARATAATALHNPGDAQRPAPQKRQPSSDQQEDRPKAQTAISVAVDLVSLQILVTDQKGNIITGLQPENFTIYEDKVKQEISHFRPVEAEITVVMLVEYSRLVSYFIHEVWNAIYGFANSLRPGDWVAVIGYDMRPTILSDFSQDRSKLFEALSRFTYPAYSESNLADALIDTLDRVEEIEGKVAVLLISTGLDTFSKATYDDSLNKCKSANASVYAISLGQNFRIRYESYMAPETNMDLLMADNRLRSFSEFTGGVAYFPRFVTEFPSIFKNISDMLRNQYSIAYASTNTKKDGKYRKVTVEVKVDLDRDGKPDKVKIMTRRGYLAQKG